MAMTAVDVAIVGGGPAGATAARHLARAGLSVRLLERESLPRYKTCGGGLVGRAVAWLGVDLSPALEAECRTAEMRFLDQAMSFRLAADEPVVKMTMRDALDRLLVTAAREAGAEVLAPCAVSGLEHGPDGVRLATGSGRFRARFVVAADGAAGSIAGWAGWRRRPPLAAALESEIEVAARDRGRFTDRALFDFGIVPHGYAWVFPKRRHLSIGCLSTRPGTRDLRQRLDGYLQRLAIEPRGRQDHGFVIPLAPRTPDLVRGRVLLTGDAAGLADPVTAEGISYAALSGRLAAEAIVRGALAPRAVARIYQRQLQRRVLGDLAAARPLARLLYDHPAAIRLVLRRAGGPLCRAMGEILAGRATYGALARSPRNYFRLLGRLVAARPAAGASVRM